MAENTRLMDSVARFTNTNLQQIKDEWNNHAPQAETPEKQGAFNKVLSKITEKHLVVAGLSVSVFLEYVSLSGEDKKRSVILRRVFKNQDDLFLDVFCLDIHAPRLIDFQKVISITDEKTKKSYSNPYEFLENVLGVSLQDKSVVSKTSQNLKEILNQLRYEITALLFISAIDGNRDVRELKTIINYVHRRCPHIAITDEELFAYFDMFYPDTQSFYYALERILGKEGWVMKMFLEEMMALIVADDKIDEKERLFLADFLAILEEEGFRLNFRKDSSH